MRHAPAWFSLWVLPMYLCTAYILFRNWSSFVWFIAMRVGTPQSCTHLGVTYRDPEEASLFRLFVLG